MNKVSYFGFYWMTHFKLRQIHHVLVTDGTALLIVPHIGDVVGQVIEVYLWERKKKDILGIYLFL